MKRRWLLVMGLALGASVVGCGGDDDGTTPAADSGPRDPTFTNVYTGVIAPNCSCHLSASGAGGLVMRDQATAYGNLVGTAAQAGGMCEPGTRVVAGDAAGSVLYRTVSGENLGGDRMPRGRAALPSADIQLIEGWIAAGAMND